MKPDWILDLTYIERRAKEMGWALSYPNKETIKQEDGKTRKIVHARRSLNEETKRR